jgi:hypothetical protein
MGAEGAENTCLAGAKNDDECIVGRTSIETEDVARLLGEGGAIIFARLIPPYSRTVNIRQWVFCKYTVRTESGGVCPHHSKGLCRPYGASEKHLGR